MNTCAATPCAPAMPSPTTARMLQPRSISMLWIWPSRSPGRRRAARRARRGRPPPPAPRSRSNARSCPARSGSPRFASSRSAPNSRCAVPGTPIIPAPSRFASAIPSMVVMPFHDRMRRGLAANHGSRPLGRKGVADPDRDPLADRGRHRLRVQDLGAEIRELHRLVVGRARRSPSPRARAADRRDSTPSTSVQITISPASSSEPKIEAEKSLPLRPSVVCRPWVSVAMKPVMTTVPSNSGGSAACRLARERSQRTPGPSGPHSTSSTRPGIEPLGSAGPAAAGAQQARKDLRRPDLAVPRDQVAHRRRRGAHRAHGLQDAGDVRQSWSRPATNSSQGPSGSRSRASCTWRARSSSSRRSSAASCRSARFTRSSSASVTPRHADSTTALRRARVGLDDRGDAPHADGIGDARAAEFMDFPGFQTRDSLCARARRHGGPSGDGPDRDPARIRRMQCNSLYLLAAQQANYDAWTGRATRNCMR